MAMDDTSRTGGPQPVTPQTLNIIRLALLGGAVMFGAVAWFLTSTGAFVPSADGGMASILQYTFFGLALLVLGGMLIIQKQTKQAASFEKRASLLLVGYALAEGVTLFGGVILLLTGRVLLFLVGLLIFFLAFLLFPLTSE